MKPLVAVSLLFVIASSAFASDATDAFDKLKTLQGTWAGKGSDGSAVQVTNRMVSSGAVLMSKMQTGDVNMVTMIHLDRDCLMLTHCCVMRNQPRTVATISGEGKTITFKFLDANNLLSSQEDYMHGIVFSLIDSDHHNETVESVTAGGKPLDQEVLHLQRTK
jgi:hypothetical protein